MSTAEIPLKNSTKVAIVDACDAELVSMFKWRLDKDGYAVTTSAVGIHRLIMQTPQGMVTDHIDGNPLNNRRNNLRVCTQQNNLWNMKAHRDSTSRYKGVSQKGNRWRAQICKDYKVMLIGYFKTEEEAAAAYNARAMELHGDYAKINRIRNG